MYKVSIKKISKSFGHSRVLDGIDLDILAGEMFFLLGPSGCGKTTLLRILAGFERPDEGNIFFNDTDATSLPPQKRNTSMVFQSYALWPHMTVFENIAYGLENRNFSKTDIHRKAGKILELVRMEEYKDRLPGQLSGGQQQRVAVARALVVEPELLLLDEPLSNLDARLRADMRAELHRLHKQTGITTAYVTHDQEEALSLADRIAFLDQGKLVQIGTARELYDSPSCIATARFLGDANIIEGIAKNASGDDVAVDTQVGTLVCSKPKGLRITENGKVDCFFRPEKAFIGLNAPNRITGRVISVMYSGDREYIMLKNAGLEFKISILAPSLSTETGKELTVGIESKNIKILAQ